MGLTETRYEQAMGHLDKARELMDGLLHSVGDGHSQALALDGCFEGLRRECEEAAEYQLGLRDAQRAQGMTE